MGSGNFTPGDPAQSFSGLTPGSGGAGAPSSEVAGPLSPSSMSSPDDLQIEKYKAQIQKHREKFNDLELGKEI